jgi:negative regulator of flagellin synthesis FlgM
VKDVGAKRVQTAKGSESSQATKAASTAATTGSAPTQIAESVQTAAKLMDVAEQELKRADEEKLEELKNAIKDGRFKVNPDKLAARLVADAFDDFY